MTIYFVELTDDNYTGFYSTLEKAREAVRDFFANSETTASWTKVKEKTLYEGVLKETWYNPDEGSSDVYYSTRELDRELE